MMCTAPQPCTYSRRSHSSQRLSRREPLSQWGYKPRRGMPVVIARVRIRSKSESISNARNQNKTKGHPQQSDHTEYQHAAVMGAPKTGQQRVALTCTITESNARTRTLTNDVRTISTHATGNREPALRLTCTISFISPSFRGESVRSGSQQKTVGCAWGHEST
jgi:hypothetical protein